MKRFIPALLAAFALLLSACGNPLQGGGEGGPDGEIIIGASDVGENLLLAEIYAGALRNAGADNVTVSPPVGSREVVAQALRDKSLSVVPEYSGNLLRYFNPDSSVTTQDEVYAELEETLPNGFEVLDQSPAQNTDVLVVRQETARQGIRSIADLGPRCAEFVFGGAGEWAERWEAQIKELYGCEFKQIQTTDTGGPVTVAALRDGDVQVANLFSTSSVIEANNFVELEDPKHMYPAQNIVPLAAAGALTPAERRALNDVSAALSTNELTRLNDQFTLEKRNPAEIADDFLREHNLI
ncbi:osmoprotectant transport system substrate-binding protein [Tamaricihabitans halophyticus]|uniref:Osmoprotectant transport system substrate-binding protein n=1 Tax=Tamaricihabitans halophyticus TaxID=1262583 RepID=A0A4R2QKZ6_9PSEU|nr:ABC transporter substrate-binding protein [Tamaricihabitans halophyticus]TCP49188.1 osmoprotectant transport system substrate-binding protein [Tamaricihabitans halophyticus]